MLVFVVVMVGASIKAHLVAYRQFAQVVHPQKAVDFCTVELFPLCHVQRPSVCLQGGDELSG